MPDDSKRDSEAEQKEGAEQLGHQLLVVVMINGSRSAEFGLARCQNVWLNGTLCPTTGMLRWMLNSKSEFTLPSTTSGSQWES